MKNTYWIPLVLLSNAALGCNQSPASFAGKLWTRFSERTGCKVTTNEQDATVDAASCSALPITSKLKAKGDTAYLERSTLDSIMKNATKEQIASAQERCRNCSQDDLQQTVAMDAVEQEVIGAFYCAAPNPDTDWKRFCEARFTLQVQPLKKPFANLPCEQLNIYVAMGREYLPWGHCK